MRLQFNGNVLHLGYCSNVHPSRSVEELVDGLRRYAVAVRHQLGTDLLSVTLWIPAAVAQELDSDASQRRALVTFLRDNGLEVVTLNGFPHSPHGGSRKYGAFRPDWAEPGRLAYTETLARVLTELLPDDAPYGSISTLPLYWRTRRDRRTHDLAASAMARADECMRELEGRTGRVIRIGLEPEPGCVIETVPEGVEFLRAQHYSHIGLCVDTLHMGVQFEVPEESLAAAGAAGVRVVKSQLANGLRAQRPLDSPWLQDFGNGGFLHQTRECRDDGSVHGVDDLPSALAGGLPGDGEWRVHCHYPVNIGQHSLQDYLADCLAALMGPGGPAPLHLEVETYTWRNLPDPLRPGNDSEFVTRIADELSWARDRLSELGATPL
ncbi:metabolite traffic protein EboE [Lentzea sp. NPDC051208]|uniref:metabolite traffic protein EboE n=1 Tax=Lentzea sp. NPDC051208 TaxID=3154642 RepID=UPI0034143578